MMLNRTLSFLIIINPFFIYAQLQINEFQASNDNSYFDNYQEDDDWVEIYNSADSSIDMGGMFFTDNIDDGDLYMIPDTDSSKTTIDPGEYLLFWFDKDPEQGILHIDCKLKSSGEQIALFSEDGYSLVDSLTYKNQETNISFGRKPNGALDWMFFTQPTPGMSNSSNGYLGVQYAVPAFSYASGFYDNSIQLWISSPSGHIHYTLDGSKPTINSPLFQDSIFIENTTIIRVSIFEPNFITNNIFTNTYFINEGFTDRGLSVFSISGNPKYFWDVDSGIYVQDFKPEWEYPINIECFSKSGQSRFSSLSTVRVVGDLSWQLPQKMLSISAKDNIDYRILPEFPRNEYNSFNLRCSGSDWSQTLFRDGLIQEVSNNDMDIDIQGFKPSIVYINGEYMGIHNIRQKLNDNYIEENYYIDSDNIDIIENNGEVVCGDDVAFQQLYSIFEEADLSADLEYANILNLIDIDNFIDFIITEIYSANRSWRHNIVSWKPRYINSKWRWMLIDLDRSLLKSEVSKDYISILSGNSGDNPPWSTLLFSKLLANQEFVNLFVSKFSDYLYITFHTQSMSQSIMKFKSSINNEVPFHVEKWKNDTSSYGDGIESYTFWESKVDDLLEFAEERDENVMSHLKDFFSLESVNLSLNTENNRGVIKINNLLVPESNWDGLYIKGIPVSFTAIPDSGYRFAYWEAQGLDLIDSSISILSDSLINNVILTAYFVESTVERKNLVINEINYSSSSSLLTGDWIELYNPNNYLINISNWKVFDSMNSYTIPDNTIINSNGYIVISNDILSFKRLYPDITNVIGNSGINLDNNTDLIYIHNHNGVLIDSLVYFDTYPWPNISDNPALTIELTSYFMENEEGSNWFASNSIYGTPGALNSCAKILVKGIEGQAINYGESFLEIFLDDYVYDPYFSNDSINWSIISSTNLEVSIDTISRIAIITGKSNWKGSEMIRFIATNPLGGSSVDSARFSIGTILDESIYCNKELLKNESPYLVTSTINIPSGCNMTINPGVEVIIRDNVDIIVKGQICVEGNGNDLIHFFAHDNNWGGILLDSSIEKSTFNFVIFEDGTYGEDSAKTNAVITGYYSEFDVQNSVFDNNLRCIYANHGDVYINNSIFQETNLGEKINLQFSNAVSENNVLYYTYGDNDAIDYDAVNNGIIRNNILHGGDDDGLDIGQTNNVACRNVHLSGNTIRGFLDKGVSVGEGSLDINISYNVIANSQIGIAVKDSSTSIIDHNTLYKNNIGISCYEKNIGDGGGIASVTNTIIFESITSSLFEDYVSEINISYSFSDKETLDGINNLYGDPYFVDASDNDFNLKLNSPCRNNGDPSFVIDPDGTITDIGAFFKATSGSFNVYPNPTSERISIELFDVSSIINSVSILDVNGLLIEEFNNINDIQTEIKLTKLEHTGIYFVRVLTTEDQPVFNRFIFIKPD